MLLYRILEPSPRGRSGCAGEHVWVIIGEVMTVTMTACGQCVPILANKYKTSVGTPTFEPRLLIPLVRGFFPCMGYTTYLQNCRSDSQQRNMPMTHKITVMTGILDTGKITYASAQELVALTQGDNPKH